MTVWPLESHSQPLLSSSSPVYYGPGPHHHRQQPRKQPLADRYNLPSTTRHGAGTTPALSYIHTTSSVRSTADEADPMAHDHNDEEEETLDERMPISHNHRSSRMTIESLTHPSPTSTTTTSPPFRSTGLLPPPPPTHGLHSPSYSSSSYGAGGVSPATATESSFTRSPPPPATPSHESGALPLLSPKIVTVNDHHHHNHNHHHHHHLPYPLITNVAPAASSSSLYRPSSPSSPADSTSSPATLFAGGSSSFSAGTGTSTPRLMRRHSSTRVGRASPPPIVVTREDDGDVAMASGESSSSAAVVVPRSGVFSSSGVVALEDEQKSRRDSTASRIGELPQQRGESSSLSPPSALHRQLSPTSASITALPKKEKEYRGQWANATGTRTGLTPRDMIAVDAPTKSKRRSHARRETSAVATSRAAGGSYSAIATSTSRSSGRQVSPTAQRAAAAASAPPNGGKEDARSASSHPPADEVAQQELRQSSEKPSPEALSRSDELETDDGMQDEPQSAISARTGELCETSSLQLTLPLAVIATFTKDQRSQWKAHGVPFTLSVEQKAMLAPEELSDYQITVKRRKNTVAARSTRRRKLETQKILEDENVRLKSEVEALRERLELGTRERERLQRRTNTEERKVELRSKQVGALEQALEDLARRMPQGDDLLREILERRDVYEREYRSGVDRLSRLDELLASPRISTSSSLMIE